MHALSQSPFLQALGYAIANSLWQMALLWIIVVLLTGVFRFSSPAKYKIALYAQFAGFAWFIITLQFYYTQCTETLAQTQALNDGSTASFAETSSKDFLSLLFNGMIKLEQLLPYLSLAYLLLLVFLSAKWIRNYRFAQHIKTEGLQKPDIHWKLFVSRISSMLSIKSKVRIYLSELVKSPLTVGFLKPFILIPVASINHLTTEQLEAVILHELAHIKRADYIINLFQSVIELALFFNPFTQLLSKIIKKERENSCDDWVLQFQYNPSMYADALLRIAYLQTQPALLMQATGRKGDLLGRVKRMVDTNEKVFNYRQQLIALLLMTGILSAVAWIQPSAKHPVNIARIAIKPQIAAPVVATVDNPFFSPTFFLAKPIKEEFSKAMDVAEKEISDQHTDLDDAKGEFSKMLPAAMCELKKMNLDDSIKLAMENVKDSMQGLMANEKEWGTVLKEKDLVDTALIASSLRTAYAQMKQLDFQKIIQQGFADANKQIAKMQKDQKLQLLLKTKANKALNNAFDMLNNKLLMVIPQAPSSAVAPGNNVIVRQYTKALDKQKMQQELFKIKELKLRLDSLNETVIDGHPEQNNSNQNWSYSYPVYIEHDNDDTARNFAFTVSDNTTDSAYTTANVFYTSGSQKRHSKNSYPPTPNKQTIHITKTDDGRSVNIIISIL